MNYNVSPTRGMKDSLPSEMERRDAATAIILDTYRSFGFNHLETPIVEHLALLSGGEGGENEKLIFKILKRGDKLENADKADPGELCESALRYDLTVPLSRFYAANQGKLPYPFKAIQIGPVFRAERPQKGRYRQFYQCDIDIIGDESALAELDLLYAGAATLKRLGFNNVIFHLNDRRLLNALADKCGFAESERSSLLISLDKLDKIGKDGVLKELIANGFSSEKTNGIAEFLDLVQAGKLGLTEMQAYLGEFAAAEIFDNLNFIMNSYQSDAAVKVIYDPLLARGMGYYTGPIYEIEFPGYPGSIGGGGRYDKMIGKFMNKEVPACGISLGFERIMNILEEENRNPGENKAKLILFFDDSADLRDVYGTADGLRTTYSVTVQKKGKKFGKQLKTALDNGYSSYVVYGEDEIKKLKSEGTK